MSDSNKVLPRLRWWGWRCFLHRQCYEVRPGFWHLGGFSVVWR